MNWDKLKGFLGGIAASALVACVALTANAQVGTITKDIAYRNITVTLDGQPLALKDAQGQAVEPFILDGTTYLPIRAVAGSLGLDVAWDGNANQVILQTPGASTGNTGGDSGSSGQTDTPSVPQQPQESRTVYVTRTGSKYHYDNSCNGGTYYRSTLSEALQRGLEPCKKCVLHGFVPGDATGSELYFAMGDA